MNRLYDYFLNSDCWQFENEFGEKSFCVKKSVGDWSKTIYISKYGKEYEIQVIEGTRNFIKRSKNQFKTYKEVIIYIGE